MPTRVLMSLSAALLAAAGLALSFLPQELLAWASLPLAQEAVVAAQILGALYLAFAMLNWMARGNLIGGIYSRPVAFGNFLHFTVGALALIKAVQVGLTGSAWYVIIATYVALAAAFAIVLFRPPGRLGKQPPND